MKRLLILMVCLLSLTALAQTTEQTPGNVSLDPKNVPAVVTKKFANDYPDATPIWRRDGDNFKAAYVDPDTKLGRIVVYDKSAKVIRTESEVDNMNYPSGISEYYGDNYPGETFQVWSTDKEKGGKTLYYSNRNEETIWFDNDGKVIPAKKAPATKLEEKKK